MKLSKAALLFKKAYFHNWDQGIKPLEKILKDKNCDKATALLIYWHAVPGYYNQYLTKQDVPEGERPIYNLLKRIEKRIAEGHFPEVLSFTPPSDRIPAELGQIPECMTNPTHGDESAEEVIEGDLNENLFFEALCEGDLATVKEMMESKKFAADHKVKDYAPIELVCSRGHENLLDYLIEKGANWKKKYDRNTLIHKASTPGGIRVLDRLVALGLNIDAKGEFGRTALHGSVFWPEEPWESAGMQQVTKKLCELGADSMAQDSDQKTPVDLANSAGNSAALALLASLES